MSGPELNVQLGEVGKRIMEQRKRMGLTQKELAEKIGHTTQYVSYMETGKRTINWENIVRMASVFGVSVDIFLRVMWLIRTDYCLRKNWKSLQQRKCGWLKALLMNALP